MTGVAIAVPLRAGWQSGNDVTAARWAGRLEGLGHEVEVVTIDERDARPPAAARASLESAEVLVVIHARRGASTARWWHTTYPNRPLVVGLSGTDLYHDMPDDADAMHSAEIATRLVVLQRAAVTRLASIGRDRGVDLAGRAVVIHQSVPFELPLPRPAPDETRIVVLAHLREVKAPLLAARAVRRLPAASTITVHHAGRPLDDKWRDAALDEQRTNPRYTWHGELTRDAAFELLATAHFLACTSVSEGGANVVSEAIAMGVPIIGTRIDGNTGLVGDDYPALVPVGDELALAELLRRLETDDDLVRDLRRRVRELRPITNPDTERDAWADLIASLNLSRSGSG